MSLSKVKEELVKAIDTYPSNYPSKINELDFNQSTSFSALEHLSPEQLEAFNLGRYLFMLCFSNLQADIKYKKPESGLAVKSTEDFAGL